jgi:CheY-like chemotaxis protein
MLPLVRSRYALLVADDDPLLREGMAEVLEREGYRVYVAEGGIRAVEIVRVERIHCSVFDVNMPDLSGIEALRRLADFVARIPSILMSGEASEQVVEEARAVGAFTFLRKPVPPETLRTSVARALEAFGFRA